MKIIDRRKSVSRETLFCFICVNPAADAEDGFFISENPAPDAVIVCFMMDCPIYYYILIVEK